MCQLPTSRVERWIPATSMSFLPRTQHEPCWTGSAIQMGSKHAPAPGVHRVLTAAEIEAEPEGSPFRHAFHAGRSGDMLIVPKPGWTLSGGKDAAEHRSNWNENALVPFLVASPRFWLQPALRGRTLRATQVAPSLAALLGIGPPAAAMDDSALEEIGGGSR